MLGILSIWLARALAFLAALILTIAAVAYSQSGERPAPYVAIIAVWIALYIAADFGLRRLIRKRAPGHIGILVTILAIALAGAVISFLSAGLALRYAMTPELIRDLDRKTHHESTILKQLGNRPLSYYTTNRPDLPRLIFIHGTPGHAGVFADYLLNPVTGFECVSVDRPGFGGSADCGEVTSFEAQAAAIATLLVQRDGQWPILVGHSLGGPIAARLAADYPDKVRGLVILAGSLDPDLEMPKWYNFASTVPGINMKMPAAYQTSNAELLAAPEQTRLLATMLARIHCPVQIIHGTSDTLVPVQNADFTKRALVNSPEAEVALIPGEGHAIHRQCGPQVRAAIQRIADFAAKQLP